METVTEQVDPGSGPGAVHRRPRWQLSRTTLAVLVVLAAFVVATFVIRRQVVEDDEAHRLEQRTAEVEAFLASAFGNFETTLQLLARVHEVTGPSPDAVNLVAEIALQPTPGSSVGVVELDGGETTVLAGAGDLTVGASLDGGARRAVERALAASGMLSEVYRDGEGAKLVVALPAAADGSKAVFQIVPVMPDSPQARDPGGPFSDLRAAIYASPTADRDQLMVSTEEELPIAGRTVERTMDVGADQWLVVVGSDGPLVGEFAYYLPWLVLVAGLLVTALAAGLVETLSRRKAYAEARVVDRTQRLERTMRALDEARRQAEEANRAKSEFLSRMSHELRTPLNAVLGFTQVLEMDDLSEEQRESTAQILKGGRHLLDLINEVLDLSRIETGSMSLSPEPVLVSELLGEVVELIRPLATEAAINLTSDGRRTCDRYVLADRQRVKQILLNLLSNAIKYNRPRGTVSIHCEGPRDGTLRMSVTDTGYGIRDDQLSLVFTPFERLGAEAPGVGIGLALSLRLAEAMGGTIGLSSTVGQGTTFWCELPLVEGPVERFERLDRPGRQVVEVSSGERMTVLHIEDNLSNVKLIERIFEKNGQDYRLVAAMQGQLGLELAREHQPAAILLDVHLPDIGGDVVLERLLEDPTTRSIPVIMISGDATQKQIQRLLNAGAAAYITKPIDVPNLLRVLHDLTAHGRDELAVGPVTLPRGDGRR
jgi:signal transduction histidine kinase/ActR/RegA family two-component response regulator